MIVTEIFRRTLLALPLVAGVLTAQGNEWIVDAANGAGASFTSLSAAIAAAAPGDRIFVRAGVYVENVVVDKGVTIVGWNATSYPMSIPSQPIANKLVGTLTVTNIPATETAVVSGLVIERPTTAGGLSAGIASCSGPVAFDRMYFSNGGVAVLNSTDVHLQNVRIRHNAAAVPPTSGLLVSASWVQANDLDATATNLGVEPNFYAQAAPAVEVIQNSIVCLSRPRLIGGTGGGPWITSNSTPAGGHAVKATNASIVSIVDDGASGSYLIGGRGGSRGIGSSTAIPSGQGALALDADINSSIVNKGGIVPQAGAAGANFAGGPVPGNSFSTNAGIIFAPPETPALTSIFGTTVAGGGVLSVLRSASPGLPVAVGIGTELQLTTYLPSVQFLSSNPSKALFAMTGFAGQDRFFPLAIPMPPNTLSGVRGYYFVFQGADDLYTNLYLTNSTLLVLPY